jgi:hypothetical protein
MVTRLPRPLGGLQDALPEEGRAGPAIALALEQLQTGDLPLYGAVTPTQREARGDRGQVLLQPAGEAGQIAEGLRLLGEALAVMANNGLGDLLAEAHRLQGGLLLRQDPRSSPGRSLLSASPRDCPSSAGEVVGVASGHQPESAVAAPGQSRRSATAVG